MARFCPVCGGLTEFGEPGEPCPGCLADTAPPLAGVEVVEDDGDDADLWQDTGGESKPKSDAA